MQNTTICYQFDGVQDYFEYFFVGNSQHQNSNVRNCHEQYIGGADITVKKIPTPIQIIPLKKIQFYSESNWFTFNHKIQFEFTDLKINFLI
jgi:hypothetical protein